MLKLQSPTPLDAYTFSSTGLYIKEVKISPLGHNHEGGFEWLARTAWESNTREKGDILETLKGNKALLSAARSCEGFGGLRLGMFDLKVCCISLGFYRAEDKFQIEDHPFDSYNYRIIGIPLSRDGKIVFCAPGENVKQCEIRWKAGYITYIEDVNRQGYRVGYENIFDKKRHHTEAKFSVFRITEYR